jgi:hypothetical protein
VHNARLPEMTEGLVKTGILQLEKSVSREAAKMYLSFAASPEISQIQNS